MSMRTYAGAERGAGRNGLETHAIQVLDEPHQVLALQVRSSGSIFAPAKEVANLVVKPGRGSVEVVELSQGTGRDHGDVWLIQQAAVRELNG